MKNLKTILLLTFISPMLLHASLIPRKINMSQISPKKIKHNRHNAKLASRFLRLYQHGKKNIRKLDLNLKNQLKEAKGAKNKRKLLMGLSGGQMIGLMGGLGGYYAYNKGMEEGKLEFKKLKHENAMKTFEVTMKTQQRDGLIKQMESSINELENRVGDLDSQVSNKLQEYDSNLRNSHRHY